MWFGSAAAEAVAGPPSWSQEPDAADNGAGEELEIDFKFRLKLSGLRTLPRDARFDALRAAKEWKQAALIALRDRRACDRHGQRMMRRLHRSVPT